MNWIEILGLGCVLIVILIWIGTNTFNLENFDTNLFYAKMPNIFASNAYLNNLPEKITIPTKPIGELSFDSYIYSDIISNKIICSNYTNQGDCWDNNKCQWIEKKVGEQALGNPHNAYCDLAPKWLL